MMECLGMVTRIVGSDRQMAGHFWYETIQIW